MNLPLKSLVILLPWILCAGAEAQPTADEIRQFWKEFQQDPQWVMNRRPVKRDAGGIPVDAMETRFTLAETNDSTFVITKDKRRGEFCYVDEKSQRFCLKDALPGRAPIAENDRPERLVDNAASMIRGIEEMERRGLKSAKLAETPWSDTYWPMYQGILGQRYADPSFPGSTDWKVNFDYIMKSPAPVNQDEWNRLSPSEKYDAIVGDDKKTLTRRMWSEGEEYYRDSNKVETWMGICEGWAAASFMVPRPRNQISVAKSNGESITLYPADIKGLATLLWARGYHTSRFIGGRCNDKTPKTDENGRVTSQNCFDTNPGAWHLTVVNQIGVSKRSFVIDATYDYEVWNQPVYGYSYTYFNPETGESADSFQNAKVAIGDFTKDKFRSYRSPEATHVVGVVMDLTYVVENRPTTETTNGPSQDILRTVRYHYDVELNDAGVIIGGEWYTNSHPDFLWVPAPSSKSSSVADRLLEGTWSSEDAFPASWMRAATSASAYGQPLLRVVETLVERAQKP